MIKEAYQMGDPDAVKCEFFFDNFFTSAELITHLREMKVKATGTVRSNRTDGADKILPSKNEMQKTERGTHQFLCKKEMFLTVWNDNSIVHVLSNCHQISPSAIVQRWIKKKDQQPVERPHSIKCYNEGMGGVDMLDRLLESYRPHIQMKKWWWSLFVNILNMSVVAAWRLYQKANPGEKVEHLNFRRDIVLCLLKSADAEKKRATPNANLPQDIRLNGSPDHLPAEATQGRCRVCKANTRRRCLLCNVRLHTDKGKECFAKYHRDTYFK